jgi:hypothetical protein
MSTLESAFSTLILVECDAKCFLIFNSGGRILVPRTPMHSVRKLLKGSNNREYVYV